MMNNENIQKIGFYALSGLMVFICLTTIISAVYWLNKPFSGFLVYTDTFVSASGKRDWPGPQAGIKFRERIMAVDGIPITEGADMVSAVKVKDIGTPVTYLIESAGQKREVVVPTVKFGLSDFFVVFVVPFLVGVILYAMGVIVYILKPNNAVSWTFLALCFTLGTMILAGLENQTTYFLVRFFYTINTLYAFVFLHLFLIFPEKKRIVQRFPFIEYLIYLPGVILIVLLQIYFTIFKDIFAAGPMAWFPTYRELGSINRIFTLICVAGMIVLIFHTRFRAASVQAKQRAKVIFWGVTISFGPPVIIMTLVFFVKINFPWNLLSFFVLVFPASIAYSIVKHNLFDADTIIKRTVGYIVVTTVVIGAYICVSLILNVFLGRYELAQSQIFPILFTLGVILVFNPLRDRVQSLVDRLFYRLEYDYQKTVQQISETMRSLLKLNDIGDVMMETALDTMFIESGCVMLLNRQTQDYECITMKGECLLSDSASGLTELNDEKGRPHGESPTKVIQADSITLNCEEPFIQKIAERKKAVTIYDVLEDPYFEDNRVQHQIAFKKLNATLIIPLIYEDRLTGLLSLGDKKSGKFYRREDITLLLTLVNQGAVAIENAFMLQEVIEKERMEEELSIAQDLQTSMLPASCPEIDGYKLAAFSIPAMEVGGDFYDFTETEDGATAFVIGDVTGKSVSGALVMSASRSIFRLLAEDNHSVSAIMKRANRRAKNDIKAGMFVALLYAVLNPQSRTLGLCSAGQTQPIHFCSDTGKAQLLETKGDTFPLGILADVDYQETQIQLAKGDRIVFYTDGIVEAMNEKEEIFGFERLLAIVEKNGSLSAEPLLKTIRSGVDEYVGNAPQHDDLTVIVLCVDV